jgi:hypothetical protein
MTDDPNGLDRDRLAKLLELASSPNDNEALTAVRLAHRMIRNLGASWDDVLQPWEELQVATDAVRILYEENEVLRRQVVSAPARDDDWTTTGEPQEQAKWALSLYAQHVLYLNGFEESFLQSIADWRGELTAKQSPIFQKILTQVIARSALRPP